MPEREGQEQPRQHCSQCGAQARSGNSFCVSCGQQLASNSQERDVRENEDFKLSIGSEASEGHSSSDSSRPQTNPDSASDEIKKVVRDAYKWSRDTYERANASYQEHSQNRATEQERLEKLRAIEQERSDIRAEFGRYEALFQESHKGSNYFLDWWRAYDNGEFGEGSRIADLLHAVRSRAEGGLQRVREMEAELAEYTEENEFRDKARLSLNNLKVEQENFKSNGSIFPPLIEVHGGIKSLDGWRRYTEEFEGFIRDLEDRLDSPEVSTSAANRARFPSPASQKKDASCPNCRRENSSKARFCFACGTSLTGYSGPQKPQSHSQPAQFDFNSLPGSFFVLLSIPFALVALFFLPPLFGGIGVYLGYKAKQSGSEAGGIAMMVVSGACLFLGMLSDFFYWGF